MISHRDWLFTRVLGVLYLTSIAHTSPAEPPSQALGWAFLMCCDLGCPVTDECTCVATDEDGEGKPCGQDPGAHSPAPALSLAVRSEADDSTLLFVQ